MPDHTKLSDVVFERLRDEVISGAMERGSLHSIYELADRFEMSRTPVREAAVRLADTGLVTIERNRGVRIKGLSAEEIQQVFAIRLLLEVPGAAQAASRCDPEVIAVLDARLAEMHEAVASDDAMAFWHGDYALHAAVLASFDNPRLNEYMRSLRDFTRDMGAMTVGHTRSLLDAGLEHEPIVAAIRTGNRVAAADSMAQHLVETGTLLIAQASDLNAGEASSEWAQPYLLQLGVTAG